MDNYYTSLSLLQGLKERNIACTGTYTQKSGGFPKVLGNVKLEKTRGDSAYMTLGGVYGVVKWLDTKEVYVCTNSIPVQLQTTNKLIFIFFEVLKLKTFFLVERKQRGGTVAVYDCPQVVKDYNSNYSFVDQRGQNIRKFSTYKKSHKWWHAVMFWVFDSMIWNSFLIRKYDKRGKSSQTTHKMYMLKLAEKLIVGEIEFSEKEESSELPRAENNSLGHIPTFNNLKGYCVGKCGARPQMKCILCNVYLCKNCYGNPKLHQMD